MMLSLLVHIEGLCSTLLLAAMMERIVACLTALLKIFKQTLKRASRGTYKEWLLEALQLSVKAKYSNLKAKYSNLTV